LDTKHYRVETQSLSGDLAPYATAVKKALSEVGMFLQKLLRSEETNSLLPHVKDFIAEYKGENEFACLLEEFVALRAETVSRLEAQQGLLNSAILLMAASLPTGV
jgi:hypothetical protein